jgi:hypothetical protein
MKGVGDIEGEHPAQTTAAERPPIKSRLLRLTFENIVSPFDIVLIISFIWK